MLDLSSDALLQAWELGDGQTPAAQAVTILERLQGIDALALTLGQVNRELIGLRARLLGDDAEALCDCPECGEPLEFDLALDQLVQASSPTVTAAGEPAFRLPTVSDTLELTEDRQDERERELLRRCLRSPKTEIDDELCRTVSVAMEARDPLGYIRLDLRCPACAHRWTAPLDVPGFLWVELDVWARRILADVGDLAAAYGWPEGEILALTPARRAFYLQAIG